jgi:hypothetical protein
MPVREKNQLAALMCEHPAGLYAEPGGWPDPRASLVTSALGSTTSCEPGLLAAARECIES